jgi:hypothetical protein
VTLIFCTAKKGAKIQKAKMSLLKKVLVAANFRCSTEIRRLFVHQTNTTVPKRAPKFKWGQNEFFLSKQTQIVLDEDGLVAANFGCSTSQIKDCLFTKQTQQFRKGRENSKWGKNLFFCYNKPKSF